MEKEKVLILMSTFNGENYLREQLNSLIHQTYLNLEILIRDDGSIDKTLEILNEYSMKYPNIKFYQGKNLKPAKSFLDLIKKASKAEFYAFCDQDDVWDKDKIEIAINKIKKENPENQYPCLYFSQTRLVDKDLNEINNIKRIKENKITIGNALIENIATGCTVVFNERLLELLRKIEFEDVKSGYMHDSLAYRIAFSTGKVIYDNIPHISYRQHENNVIGNSSNIKDKIKKRKNNIKKTILLRSSMSKYILENYSDKILEENIKYVKLIANYRNSFFNKMKLLFNFKIRRNSFFDDVLYRIAIVISKV